MGEEKVTLSNIMDPPEKVRLMYEAVSELARGKTDISGITVQDITKKAGIGKGTAYEYFSSKEVLIASALAYEYLCKMQTLVEQVMQETDFRKRCYQVMDWIKENREYNLMYTRMIQVGFGGPLDCEDVKMHFSEQLLQEAHIYIASSIEQLMEEGYRAGIFCEQNKKKRQLAFLSAMMQYACVSMGKNTSILEELGEEEIRTFIYQSMVKALN